MDQAKLQNLAALDSATHYWHYDKLYLYVKIGKLTESEKFKNQLLNLPDLIQRKNGRKVLLELTDMVKISLEDQFYISHIFIPDMVKNGLKNMAIVTSFNNLLEKLFVDQIRNSLQSELVEFQFFSSNKEAEEWLDEY